MATVKQKVYLITEQQRNALLNYLQNQPYREVALAVQFLAKAPSSEISLEAPDEQTEKTVAQETPQTNLNSENLQLEVVAPAL
ncbi:MAG: hypothetical protein ACFB4I_19320 [Cyanophyceae cyanobacterium]